MHTGPTLGLYFSIALRASLWSPVKRYSEDRIEILSTAGVNNVATLEQGM